MTPSKSQARTPKRKATAPVRGRPANRSSEETRALIIAQAQELFGQRGYEGVTLKAIADGCNLNSRALAYYFPSKRDLFDAAATEALDRIGGQILADVFGEPRAGRRIDGYVEAFRRIHRDDPNLLGFLAALMVEHRSAISGSGTLLRATKDPSAQRLQGHADAFGAFINLFIDEGIDSGEINPGVDRSGTALLFLAIGLGVCMVSLSDPGDVPAMLDSLDLLHHGELFMRRDGAD